MWDELALARIIEWASTLDNRVHLVSFAFALLFRCFSFAVPLLFPEAKFAKAKFAKAKFAEAKFAKAKLAKAKFAKAKFAKAKFAKAKLAKAKFAKAKFAKAEFAKAKFAEALHWRPKKLLGLCIGDLKSC